MLVCFECVIVLIEDEDLECVELVYEVMVFVWWVDVWCVFEVVLSLICSRDAR